MSSTDWATTEEIQQFFDEVYGTFTTTLFGGGFAVVEIGKFPIYAVAQMTWCDNCNDWHLVVAAMN